VIRVLIADDEPLIRAGVRAVVGADPQIEVVAEAADGREAVELVRSHRPDVALVDIVMPEVDGLTVVGEINRAAVPTAVIVLTTYSDDAYVARALDEGASGFLLKAGAPRELLAAVHAAADGASYLSPRIAKRVIAELTNRGAARDRVADLTDREREVLALVGRGLSNAEIARRLRIAEGTVKVFVSAILRRLGAHNRVQAAIVAYEAGLVDSEPDGGLRPS
jgi:DNA-binding NarL/FixJ family response regulator